jgi:hypothetical protein
MITFPLTTTRAHENRVFNQKLMLVVAFRMVTAAPVETLAASLMSFRKKKKKTTTNVRH